TLSTTYVLVTTRASSTFSSTSTAGTSMNSMEARVSRDARVGITHRPRDATRRNPTNRPVARRDVRSASTRRIHRACRVRFDGHGGEALVMLPLALMWELAAYLVACVILLGLFLAVTDWIA